MAQPATDAAAQHEVLAALAGGRSLTAGQAAALGDPVVAPGEVSRALSSAPSGRSPGHDGIPVELWRRFKDALAPLLARLFTAINTVTALPHRFLEGLVTVIAKAGDPTDPANYRPITLLCTDYRLYTKVLALRLNPHLADIIDPEQTAFVPGRRIGENIITLQCLGELLRLEGRSAVVAFTDTAKAFDTADRNFLFSAMATLGVGGGFLGMVRLLLTDTTARAHVNGWTSTPAPTAAGVRQGCPLSPLLYLFIAQALLRLLKARGIGIDVAGRRLAALQYADDTKPLLPSLDQLPALLDAYDTFRRATGQRLNLSKSKLLPIGTVPAGLPPAAGGMEVVGGATALGIVFGSTATPAARWPDLVAGVERCYTRIANLPPTFSAFGRAFAASAYGVSKLLYHAEFTGAPPAPHLTRLATVTARLVDRRLAPGDAAGRRFAGVAAHLQAGRPADGGFGALAWRQHITSRHAWWATQLIAAPAATPWVAVARALLRACAPEVGSHPLGLLLWPADEPVPGRVTLLPEPLRRLHTALAALPRVQDLVAAPLAPGPWCLAAPLWGNPFFASPARPSGLDLDFLDVAAAGISTLAQLLAARQAVAASLHSAAAYQPVWHTHLLRHPPFADRHHAAERLHHLLAALPPTWVAAAQAAAPAVAAGQLPPPSQPAALDQLLPRLGWGPPGGDRAPITPFTYTVRDGTAILAAPVELERQDRLTTFAHLAGGNLVELRALLSAVWRRLPWENCYKETYWRLVFNALPTAERIRPGQPCICGHPQPDRRHYYCGGCQPSAAIVASIHAALADANPTAPAPSRPQLWLMRPPAGVHAGVWQAVCLAALAAAESARKRLYALSVAPQPPHVPTVLARTARWAVARFWFLLADFVALRRVPRAWRAACPPGHPFLSFDPHARRWSVDRPVAAPHTPLH